MAMEQAAPAAQEAPAQGGNPLEAVGQMVEGMMAAAQQSGNKEAVMAAQGVAQAVQQFMDVIGGGQAQGGAVQASGEGQNAVPAEL